jgi:hypothetical protein
LAYAYELGKIRPDRGEFIDKGNQVYAITHPDFGNGGAKGDGVTDDTLAIQACIDLAVENRGTVFVPAGIFKHTGLTATDRVRIIGTGPDSILRNVATDGSHGLHVMNGATTIDGWFIANLTMAGEASSGDVVRLTCCHRGLMQNVCIPSAPGVGVRVDGSLLNTFVSVHVSTNHPYTAGTAAVGRHVRGQWF